MPIVKNKTCLNCGKKFDGYPKTEFCCSDCYFEGHIRKEDNGCWTWIGHFHHDPQNRRRPYPVMFPAVEGKKGRSLIIASRYAFNKIRPLRKQSHLVNTCGNLECVNPEHFKIGYVQKKGRSVEEVLDSIPDELVDLVVSFRDNMKKIQEEHNIDPGVIRRVWQTVRRMSKIDISMPKVRGGGERKVDLFTYIRILKEIRSGKSPRTIAEELGVHESLISRMISGER